MRKICETIDDLYTCTFGGLPVLTYQVFAFLTESQIIDLHSGSVPDFDLRIGSRILTFERKCALQRLGL